MKLEKITLALMLLSATCVAAADNAPPRDKQDFATMKQDVIRRLNTELVCVQAARDENALRACRPKPPAMPDGGNPPPPPPN